MSDPLVTRTKIIGLFTEIRAQGVEEALKKLALDYIKEFGTNIHVEWYLKQTGTPIPVKEAK